MSLWCTWLWYSGSPTTNVTECVDPCKLTYCNACYYCNTTLQTPTECDDCCEDRLCLACVREWAACVKDRDKRHNEVRMTRNIWILFV